MESAKIEEQTYKQEVQNYKTYLEDKSKFEQDSIKYGNYLKEITTYRENYQQYEADKKLYDEAFVANKEKQDTYQSELKTLWRSVSYNGIYLIQEEGIYIKTS